MHPSIGTGVWEKFTLRDGLPDMKIECISGDGESGLWVGTHDRGLVHYDGDTFVPYTVRDGLPGNGVFSILRSGRHLYLGTNGGLARFGEDGCVSLADGQPMSFLWGSCQLASGDMLFGLDRRQASPAAVYRLSQSGGQLIQVGEESPRHGESIGSLASDGDTVWLGSDGLYKSCDGLTFDRVHGLRDTVQSIVCDGDGTIWIGTFGGLLSYRDGEFTRHTTETDNYGPVSLSLDAEGRCWFVTYDGRFGCQDGTLVHIVHRMNATHRGGLILDGQGRWWIGTYGMGLYCYEPNRFRTFSKRDSLPSNTVSCLGGGHGGPVWCGTDAGIVGITASGTVDFDGGADLAGRNVTSMLSDYAGALWVGTRNGWLYHQTEAGLVPVDIDEGMRGYSISCLVQGLDKSIWFGSRHGGGFGRIYDGTHVHYHPEEGADCPLWVGAMAPGIGHVVWIGSASPNTWDGLCRSEDGRFEHVAGCSGTSVLALLCDSRGRLWVGTNDGVVRLDAEFVLTFNMDDGLPCEIVTAALEDSSGRIWFGTEGGGVCCHDGNVFQVIQLADDPMLNVVHDILETDDGLIWFATNAGVVRYCPCRAGVAIEVTHVVAGSSTTHPTEVQFATTVGRVSFHYRARSEIEPSRYLVYQYQLVGHDKEFSQTRDRVAEYSALAPGQYEFHVQAVDRDLNYSPMVVVQVTVTEDPRIAALNEALRAGSSVGEFIGGSSALEDVRRQIREVAWTDLTVLVLGETGTGKGLAARAIHEFSERSKRPFIHVNCGALQEGLVDSELFGHEKGAFTGAIARKLGKFELAEGGTIFLDEIGDLPPESQTRLLHVLQDRTIQRVGGTQSLSLDVRVIAATNRELSQAVREGAYRADLYYRLNVFPIRLPPLRERKDDIPALSAHFAQEFAAHLSCSQPIVDDEAIAALMEHEWPGNVRELEHTIQRAVIQARGGLIRPADFGMAQVSDGSPAHGAGTEILPLEEYERRYIAQVLRRTGGVIHGDKGAARLLGMKPTTLRSRIEKLGLRKDDFTG